MLFVPGPLESETRVYKKWSDACLGGERVSRHFAKCLEGVGWDGRRATTFRGMSAAGMSCFGAGCHIRRGVAELAKQVATAVTRGASLVGITSALPSRSRTDDDQGMPPNPRLDGKRAAGEMRRGRRRGW